MTSKWSSTVSLPMYHFIFWSSFLHFEWLFEPQLITRSSQPRHQTHSSLCHNHIPLMVGRFLGHEFEIIAREEIVYPCPSKLADIRQMRTNPTISWFFNRFPPLHNRQNQLFGNSLQFNSIWLLYQPQRVEAGDGTFFRNTFSELWFQISFEH
jgi:hypothetical protein